MTPVGYAWMPVLDSQVVRGDENNLPVALYLPENYLINDLSSSNSANSVIGVSPNGNVGGKSPNTGNSGPEFKWADGKGQKLFKVNTKLVSTIYSQVSLLFLNKSK